MSHKWANIKVSVEAEENNFSLLSNDATFLWYNPITNDGTFPEDVSDNYLWATDYAHDA